MTTTSPTDPRAIATTFARLALAAAVAFVVLLVTAQLAQPSVDPSWQPPSELALGPLGWLMTAAFVALGIAGVALFGALRGQSATRPATIGRALVLIGGSAGFLAGIFPTDPATTAPDAMTLTGKIHALGPVLADAFPVASVVLAVSLTRRSTGWRPRRALLVIASAVLVGATVVLTVSMVALMPASGMLGPDVPLGWPARALLLAEGLWVAALAGCALAVQRAGGQVEQRDAVPPTRLLAS